MECVCLQRWCARASPHDQVFATTAPQFCPASDISSANRNKSSSITWPISSGRQPTRGRSSATRTRPTWPMGCQCLATADRPARFTARGSQPAATNRGALNQQGAQGLFAAPIADVARRRGHAVVAAPCPLRLLWDRVGTVHARRG